MSNIPNRKPKTKTLDGRAIAHALDGKERDYPVYRFSQGRYRYEKPKHNPFQGL